MFPKDFRWQDFSDGQVFFKCLFQRNVRFTDKGDSKCLTTITNIDILILDYLTELDLLKLTGVNKYFNELFYDDRLWISRIKREYPVLSIKKIREKYLNGMTWREYYFWLVHILEEQSPDYTYARALEWKRDDLINILEDRYIYEKDISTYKKRIDGSIIKYYRINKKYNGKWTEICQTSMIEKWYNDGKHDGLYRVSDRDGVFLTLEYYIDIVQHETFTLYIIDTTDQDVLDPVIEFLNVIFTDLYHPKYPYDKHNYKKGRKIYKEIFSERLMFEPAIIIKMLTIQSFQKLFRNNLLFSWFSTRNFYGQERPLLKDNRFRCKLKSVYDELLECYVNNPDKYPNTKKYVNFDDLQKEQVEKRKRRMTNILPKRLRENIQSYRHTDNLVKIIHDVKEYDDTIPDEYCHQEDEHYQYELIAHDYVPNPHNYINVRHINGDKHDFHYKNLEWIP